MANRTRNIVLRVPVTPEERALIQQKMAQLHTKNFSAYARKMLIDGYIVHMDTSDIRAQTAELQKIGVNVNQIARRINSTETVYAQDIEDIKGALAKIWQLQRCSKPSRLQFRRKSIGICFLCKSASLHSVQRGCIRSRRVRFTGVSSTARKLLCDLSSKVSHASVHPIAGAGLVGKPTMDGQHHFTRLRRVVESLGLVPKPQQFVLAVAFADVYAKLNELVVNNILKGIRFCGIRYIESGWSFQYNCESTPNKR